MRTRRELLKLTTIQLGKIAHELLIPKNGGMDKAKLIETILKTEEMKAVEGEPIYKDRNEKVIIVGSRVNCRVGDKWPKGEVTKLKMIEDDQYAMVLLDDAEKTKMFHTIDVELSKSKKETLAKLLETTTQMEEELQAVMEADSISEAEQDAAIREMAEQEDPAVKAQMKKEEKALAKTVASTPVEKPKKEKEEKAAKETSKGEKSDAPKEGSKSATVLELLKSGKTRSQVAKETGIVYQFVRAVEIRYMK